MSYLTPATFKLRAIPSGSYNELADTVIQTALDAASSEIDSALRPYHSLPMNTGSYASELASIYEAEAVITSYRLMQHVGFKPQIAGGSDDLLNQRYIEITAPDNGFLARIAAGKLIFPSEADNTPTKKERRSKLWGKPGRTTRRYDSNGNEILGY